MNEQETGVAARQRARDVGLHFAGRPGRQNAVTDVPGVCVGQTTLVYGDGPLVRGVGPVRTGVTVLLPLGHDGVGTAMAAGLHNQNGNGELTGSHWIAESGTINTPIVLTNTHAVGTAHRAVIDWVRDHHSPVVAQWLLPVVGETWDGYLNDINGNHLQPQHVYDALHRAQGGAVTEGSSGGGTGMNCYGLKGGNGTSSRLVDFGGATYTVGVFLQANFGDRDELTYRGRAIGSRLTAPNPMATENWLAVDRVPPGAGSCIAVVITDAPLLSDQLRALARRVTLGLARTGTAGSHFSGDIFLAVSTANVGAFDSDFPDGPASVRQLAMIPWGQMDPFFTAVVQATEEAVWNALVVNETMVGRDGHTSYALSHEELRAAL